MWVKETTGVTSVLGITRHLELRDRDQENKGWINTRCYPYLDGKRGFQVLLDQTK